MEDRRMIFPEPFFVRAWESKAISVPDIALIYGTSRAAIYRAAKRFGLPPRNPPPAEPQEVWPDNPPDDLHGALLWSRGKWSLLNRVADEHGLTSIQAQTAYHRERKIAQSNIADGPKAD